MKYIITENQYVELVNKRKTNRIANQILSDIDRAKRNLHESVILNEAIVDTLRKYAKRGLLSVGVISTLLANNVQASDLQKAGVSPNEIQIAQQNQNVNSKAVERAILNNLKRSGQKGTIQQFNSLDDQRKNNMINAIINDIGDDIGELRNMDISLYLNKSNELGGDQFTKIGETKTITVDTIYVDVLKDYTAKFGFNSAKLNDQQKIKQEFQEYLNTFYNVDKITIVASSSTLRNTGDMEGITWKESSQMRVDVIKNLLMEMTYNLGGCGKNETHTITKNMIYQNINGTNGDGTSGPQSPFESDQKTIQSYNERGIDSAMWKSTAKEPPIITLDQLKSDQNLIRKYQKYQYVKVVITGQVVETKTNEIINMDYLKLAIKKDGGNIKKNPKGRQQGIKVQACPVKVLQ